MIQPDDYKLNVFGVMPVADPNTSSEAQRLARAQALLNQMQNPNIDPREVTRIYLEALHTPNITKVMTPTPKPTDPPTPQQIMENLAIAEKQAGIQKIKTETGAIIMDRELKASELGIKEKDLQVRAEGVAATAASQKMNSIAQMATTIATAGKQSVAEAEQVETKEEGIAQAQVRPDELPQQPGQQGQQGQPGQQGQQQGQPQQQGDQQSQELPSEEDMLAQHASELQQGQGQDQSGSPQQESTDAGIGTSQSLPPQAEGALTRTTNAAAQAES
jgi:hypothetical protein